MALKLFEELFIKEISDLYHAEKQLLKALPKMAKASTNEVLVEAFENHLKQTEKQVERLDRVFASCNVKPKRIKCVGMEGIIEEGSQTIAEVEEGELRDAGIMIAAQKIEHYEIAAYDSLITWARQLEFEEAAKLLEETLEEERATSEKLTEIAEEEIGEMAESA